MNAISTPTGPAAAADAVPATAAPLTGDDGIARNADLARWRPALESRWQRKIDEIVVLSRAGCGLSGDPDDTVGYQAGRLGARIARNYDELAAIEEALGRLADGSYGVCSGCDQPMGDEWLAEGPATRYCPDCSLRLVSWQPRSEQKAVSVERADRPAGSAGILSVVPTAAQGVRRQRRRTTAAGRA